MKASREIRVTGTNVSRRRRPSRPSHKGIQDMMVHLWTCLNEVSAMATIVADRNEPFSDATRRTFQNIAELSDVRKISARMHQLIADAARQEVSEVADLREQVVALREVLAQTRLGLETVTVIMADRWTPVGSNPHEEGSKASLAGTS